jgi:regulator of replication initiation timing
LRIDLLHRQIEAEMQGEIDELKKENAGLKMENAYLNTTVADTRLLLDSRTTGLETIQRIAEAGGLVLSDRDDIESTYRRRR